MKMRRAIALLLLCVCSSINSACSSPTGTKPQAISSNALPLDAVNVRDLLDSRYRLKSGEFSLQPPKGWLVETIPEFPYEAFTEPGGSDRERAHINLLVEPYTGTPVDYAEENLIAFTRAWKNLRHLGRREFQIASGQSGIAMEIESEQFGKRTRQIFYFLAIATQRMAAITCTSPAIAGERYRQLCDSSIGTLRLEKR